MKSLSVKVKRGNDKRMVVMRLEPSSRFSEIFSEVIGVPGTRYFIERRIPLKNLKLTDEQLRALERGDEIEHMVKVYKDEQG